MPGYYHYSDIFCVGRQLLLLVGNRLRIVPLFSFFVTYSIHSSHFFRFTVTWCQQNSPPHKEDKSVNERFCHTPHTPCLFSTLLTRKSRRAQSGVSSRWRNGMHRWNSRSRGPLRPSCPCHTFWRSIPASCPIRVDRACPIQKRRVGSLVPITRPALKTWSESTSPPPQLPPCWDVSSWVSVSQRARTHDRSISDDKETTFFSSPTKCTFVMCLKHIFTGFGANLPIALARKFLGRSICSHWRMASLIPF